MKKIVALLLVVILAVSLVGCTGSKEAIEKVTKCYSVSYPDKIVVVSTQAFGNEILENTTIITHGKVDGVNAATMTVKGEQMRTVESGSGMIVYGPIEELNITKWYKEGVGVSEDLGTTWDSDAESFVPESISIELRESAMSDIVYEDNKLTFTVAADKTADFFGEGAAVGAKVTVEIVTDGAVVTNVTMSWVLPVNTDTGVEQTTVTVKTSYYYDIQLIDM